MTRSINLEHLTTEQLKNYLANARRLGQTDIANNVLGEMARRGVATSRDYASLAWNQQRIRQVMQDFRSVAAEVRSNQRTPYTEAGGLRIGHSKDEPEWMWIDTYSAIKTSEINAVFGCYVRRPGDEPEFRLQIDGDRIRTYNADQLPEALNEWRSIASKQIEAGSD